MRLWFDINILCLFVKLDNDFLMDDGASIFYRLPVEVPFLRYKVGEWFLGPHQSIDDVMMMDTHFSIHVLQQKL